MASVCACWWSVECYIKLNIIADALLCVWREEVAGDLQRFLSLVRAVMLELLALGT